MDIDTEIAKATEVAVEQPASIKEAAIETPEVVKDEDVGNKPDTELTPEQLDKRNKNRQSHENSKLAKLRRENRELKAQFEQFSKQPSPQQDKAPLRQEYQNDADFTADTERFKKGAPMMKDFQDYGSFLKADTKWELKQEQVQESPKQLDSTSAARANEINNQRTSLLKQAPDYADLVSQNPEFFNDVDTNPILRNAIIEANNAPLALYALMKEGKLDDLYDLTPTQIAAELVEARIRGQDYLTPVKTVTNAPAPLTPSRSTTKGGKTDDDLVDELFAATKR